VSFSGRLRRLCMYENRRNGIRQLITAADCMQSASPSEVAFQLTDLIKSKHRPPPLNADRFQFNLVRVPGRSTVMCTAIHETTKPHIAYVRIVCNFCWRRVWFPWCSTTGSGRWVIGSKVQTGPSRQHWSNL